MRIIGIHDGHNSGVALFNNGKLEFAISEERLSRKKNEYSFPALSIKYCMKKFKLKNYHIDYVAVSTTDLPPKYFAIKRNTSFKIEDYLQEQEKYWYPRLYKKKKVRYLDIFKNKILRKKQIHYDIKKIKNEDDTKKMKKVRLDYISNYFKINPNKVRFFDHHKCHAYYGFFSSGLKNKKKIAVVTADGGGDGVNGSIWLWEKNKLTQKFRTNLCNIGRIYRYVTLILGMKPTEHEYKVMGLAGYGLKNSHYYNYTNKVFDETLNCRGINFYYKKKPKDLYFYFKEKLNNQRFDAISYSLQRFVENIFVKWFENISKKFKVNHFVFSGGVAQNIKATKKIIEKKFAKSLFVPPGPGDESLCIGAGYCLISEISGFEKIKPFETPYVGSYYDSSDLNFIMKDRSLNTRVVDERYVAKLLKYGEPVAIFDLNQSEFGPRALGRRSIIAKPDDQAILHKINKFIKVRDFWMPFAPSILSHKLKKYLNLIKGAMPFYMTNSFDTNEIGAKNLAAATHPFDKTARPQAVLKKTNPRYYKIIKEFENLTGISAVLNTSFNLHGEPIVESPKDAVRVLKKSGLKYLYIDNLLVSKK